MRFAFSQSHSQSSRQGHFSQLQRVGDLVSQRASVRARNSSSLRRYSDGVGTSLRLLLNDTDIEIGKRFSFCLEEQFQNQHRFEVGFCPYGSKRMGICARLVHSDVSHNGFLSKIKPALCRRAQISIRLSFRGTSSYIRRRLSHGEEYHR